MSNLFPVPDWARGLFPERVEGWERVVGHPELGDFVYVWRAWSSNRLLVMCSARVEADGKRWMHVSCSHQDRVPNWHEMARVKEAFIGPDRKAIQVLPARAEHVDLHPTCLHWWACLDGDPLPDFRLENGEI